MFADITERASAYTRPVKTISRLYRSEEVIPGTAALFFVNSEGAAVTTRQVAEEIMRAARVNSRYESFKKERADIPPESNFRIETNRLERRYEYTKGESRIQFRYHFYKCFEKTVRLSIEMHTFYDIALIRFGEFQNPAYKGYALFPKKDAGIKLGMSVMKLGFPIMEFSDYAYVREKDDIAWTQTGEHSVSPYPADGIVVRTKENEEGRTFSFEMSGFSAKGYNGAPVLSKDGTLAGMVTGTVTRIVDGVPVVTTECVSERVIRSFLEEKKIRYSEGQN